MEGSLVQGGVVIGHQILEGKHQYEVENVVKYKKTTGEKTFVRRGDKLMQINDLDVKDLTPEELAHLIAEGNPKLTVHKAGKTEPCQQFPLTEDTLRPVSKESTILSFCMELTREEDLEEDKVGQQGQGDEGLVDDVCPAENEEGGKEGPLFVVSMRRTSISVVRGRGCDKGSFCQGCHGTGCTLNDIVVVSSSSTVTLVPRGSGSFKQEKSVNASVEHVVSHQYLRGLCLQKIIYASPNPEKITIYTYKSNIIQRLFRGQPVVLNLTESNCFFRCCKEGDRVFLRVETCEKQKLKRISPSDEVTLSFVFYMDVDRSKQRKFESALHRGWFIRVINTDSVQMATLDGGQEEQSFLFVIRQ